MIVLQLEERKLRLPLFIPLLTSQLQNNASCLAAERRPGSS
jgi:hypothetical protein